MFFFSFSNYFIFIQGVFLGFYSRIIVRLNDCKKLILGSFVPEKKISLASKDSYQMLIFFFSPNSVRQ